jgi:hypothetical protein
MTLIYKDIEYVKGRPAPYYPFLCMYRQPVKHIVSSLLQAIWSSSRTSESTTTKKENNTLSLKGKAKYSENVELL